MYKKIMLSAAAAMTLSTGAFAFDTTDETNGVIQTVNASGTLITNTYVTGNELNATNALALSGNAFGDALVFPAFQGASGWESEIEVRNTSVNAVVAKAVLYSASTSEEIMDFNIYLSGKDVFKFTISDGVVSTTDGSVAASESFPNDAVTGDVVTMNTPGNSLTLKSGLATHDGTAVNSGYVVVYGMTEVTSRDDRSIAAHLGTPDQALSTSPFTEQSYHTQHAKLWADYRTLLDNCRSTNWRQAYNTNAMINGMITGVNVGTPNTDMTACGVGVENNTTETNTTFQSVDAAALTGTVRITAAGSSKDMIIPATAVSNFTDTNQGLLWSVGEYASFADRVIEANASEANYDEAGVIRDSQAFDISYIDMAYTDKDEDATVLITQPYKRVLVQLGNDEGLFTGVTNIDATNMYNTNCSVYGDLTLSAQPFDLEEATTTPTGVAGQLFISPFTSGTASETNRCDELVSMRKDQLVSDFGALNPNNGHIEISGTMRGIVTQMAGSTSTGTAQTNWFYAPAK